MIVFKTFFRILRKNKGSILFPIALFIVISFAINMNTRSSSEEFQKIKATVAIINHGDETVVSEGLRTYIEENMILLDLDEKFVDDAIFYRQADFIAIIQKDGTLDFEMIYDANFAYLAKMDLNQFFHDIDVYKTYQSHLSDQEVVDRVLADAQSKISVEVLNEKNNDDYFIATYFNSLSYIVMVLLLGVMGKGLLTFNKPILRARADVSSLSSKKQGFQLIGASIVTMHALWLVVSAVTLIIIRDKIGEIGLGLFFLNMYVMTWSVLAISFLLSRLIRSESALSAITTGVSLGLAFISGAFVPQSVLSATILSFAKFSPVYWAVLANNRIGDGSGSIVFPILIQILFAVSLTLVGLIISRQRKSNELLSR